MEVIASISEHKKAERIELHHHCGVEAACVVQGTMSTPLAGIP